MEDASRIVQKFLLRRGDVSDLSDLHAAIAAWTSVQRRLRMERKMELQERGAIQEDQWASVTALMSRLYNMQELAKRICLAIELTPAAKKALDAPELPEEDAGGDLDLDTSLPPSTKSDKHSFSMDWAIKPR